MDLESLLKDVFGFKKSKVPNGVQGTSWKYLGAVPVYCKDCDLPLRMLANVLETEFSAGALFACLYCNELIYGVDLPGSEKRFLSDYWKFSKGHLDALDNANLSLAIAKKDRGQIEEDYSELSAQDIYIKQGMRIVCWMKKAEAEAILEAYENEVSVQTFDDFGRRFSVIWHDDPNLQEEFNTNANALLIRHRQNGDRKIGWIYKFEAEIALDALDSHETFEIDLNGDIPGALQYYDSSTAEAKKYKANVCLFRRRGYKYDL